MSTHHTRHCELPVFFATTEGQTQRIAERLAAVLREHGLASEAIEVGSPEAYCLDWTDVRGAIVGASIHAQRHQREARKFVSRFADELNRVPSAFFSVSLSAASSNVDEVRAAQALADAFPPAHGWRPAIVASVAGRLAYTRYGFLKRWLMKRIAEKEGAPTDTSRDYEMTNWEELEQFGRALVGLIDERAARKQLAAA
jgi:menaquinone-dependent protoporphyrinogen oxidase